MIHSEILFVALHQFPSVSPKPDGWQNTQAKCTSRRARGDHAQRSTAPEAEGVLSCHFCTSLAATMTIIRPPSAPNQGFCARCPPTQSLSLRGICDPAIVAVRSEEPMGRDITSRRRAGQEKSRHRASSCQVQIRGASFAQSSSYTRLSRTRSRVAGMQSAAAQHAQHKFPLPDCPFDATLAPKKSTHFTLISRRSCVYPQSPRNFSPSQAPKPSKQSYVVAQHRRAAEGRCFVCNDDAEKLCLFMHWGSACIGSTRVIRY